MRHLYPLPCDAPAQITPLNPDCQCGAAMYLHEPDITESGAPHFGVCTLPGGGCAGFTEPGD